MPESYEQRTRPRRVPQREWDRLGINEQPAPSFDDDDEVDRNTMVINNVLKTADRMNHTKVCRCGRVFKGGHTAKFCSDDCRKAYAHEKRKIDKPVYDQRKCAQCGEMYIPTVANQKYCGTVCYNARRRVRDNLRKKNLYQKSRRETVTQTRG